MPSAAVLPIVIVLVTVAGGAVFVVCVSADAEANDSGQPSRVFVKTAVLRLPLSSLASKDSERSNESPL